MGRPCRKLAEAHLARFSAHCLLGDGDAKFLEHPMAKIDASPTHDAMDCRRWSFLDHFHQRGAVRVIELWSLPRRLAVDESVGTMCSHILLGDLYRSSRRLLSQSMSPEPSSLVWSLHFQGLQLDMGEAKEASPAGASRELAAGARAETFEPFLIGHFSGTFVNIQNRCIRPKAHMQEKRRAIKVGGGRYNMFRGRFDPGDRRGNFSVNRHVNGCVHLHCILLHGEAHNRIAGPGDDLSPIRSRRRRRLSPIERATHVDEPPTSRAPARPPLCA